MDSCNVPDSWRQEEYTECTLRSLDELVEEGAKPLTAATRTQSQISSEKREEEANEKYHRNQIQELMVLSHFPDVDTPSF